MLETAASVEWTVVSNEVEALVLEHTWINQFDPRFNVMFKDDKSYPFVALTLQETYPRVFVTRSQRKKGVTYFGPYVNVGAMQHTLDTLLEALPMRSCSEATFRTAVREQRPCLLGHIDKCSAPCVGRISEEDHRDSAHKMARILNGDASDFIRNLTTDMEAAAAGENFEKAARYRDRLSAVKSVIQDNAMVLEPGATIDVIALYEAEFEAAGHAFFVRDGRILGARTWIIDKPHPVETEDVVRQLLQQMYQESSTVPPVLALSHMPADETHVRTWLEQIRGSSVKLTVPARGKKSALVDTARSNAQEAFERHRLKRAQDVNMRSQALRELATALDMESTPLRIESFDISHTGGTHQAASMVVFEDALPRKNHYRTFTVDQRDDTAAMYDVILRRFTRYLEESALPADQRDNARFAYPPQLVVVDGGAPQVAAATRALKELGITHVAVCGLAKRLEEVWVPGESFPRILPRGSEALFLLQRVRDEAHRFALRAHRHKRSKAALRSSLDEVPGVGPQRAQTLVKHFGSVAKIAEASVEEIATIPGIGSETARKIAAALAPDTDMREE